MWGRRRNRQTGRTRAEEIVAAAQLTGARVFAETLIRRLTASPAGWTEMHVKAVANDVLGEMARTAEQGDPGLGRLQRDTAPPHGARTSGVLSRRWSCAACGAAGAVEVRLTPALHSRHPAVIDVTVERARAAHARMAPACAGVDLKLAVPV